MRRGDALDEQLPGPQREVDRTGHAFLRGQKQSLQIIAGEIQLFTFMHEVAINCRHIVFDAHLLAAKYEFFEFAMCGNECDRSRRLECNSAFGAEHRIAQVDAAANAVVACQCFEFFNQGDGLQGLAIQCNGNAASKFQRMVSRWLRVGERTR